MFPIPPVFFININYPLRLLIPLIPNFYPTFHTLKFKCLYFPSRVFHHCHNFKIIHFSCCTKHTHTHISVHIFQISFFSVYITDFGWSIDHLHLRLHLHSYSCLLFFYFLFIFSVAKKKEKKRLYFFFFFFAVFKRKIKTVSVLALLYAHLFYFLFSYIFTFDLKNAFTITKFRFNKSWDTRGNIFNRLFITFRHFC